jgi:hypothetical protein
MSNGGQAGHINTSLKSVLFPDYIYNRETPDDPASSLHQGTRASTSRYSMLSYHPRMPLDHHYLLEVSDAKVTFWLTPLL